MRKVKVIFDCDNSAFTNDFLEESARILRTAADKLEEGYTFSFLFDSNGNNVGSVEVRSKK